MTAMVATLMLHCSPHCAVQGRRCPSPNHPQPLPSPNTVSAPTPDRIVIATRESRLALWRAEHVKARLEALYPSCKVELLGMTTRGDQILDRPLAKVGGKGLFVRNSKPRSSTAPPTSPCIR